MNLGSPMPSRKKPWSSEILFMMSRVRSAIIVFSVYIFSLRIIIGHDAVASIHSHICDAENHIVFGTIIPRVGNGRIIHTTRSRIVVSSGKPSCVHCHANYQLSEVETAGQWSSKIH